MTRIGFLLGIRPPFAKWAPRSFAGGCQSHTTSRAQGSLKLEFASTSIQGSQGAARARGDKGRMAGPLPSRHLSMSRRDSSWPKGDCDVHSRGECEQQTWGCRSQIWKEENFNRWEGPSRAVEQNMQRYRDNLKHMNLSFLLGGNDQISTITGRSTSSRHTGRGTASVARPADLKICSLES